MLLLPTQPLTNSAMIIWKMSHEKVEAGKFDIGSYEEPRHAGSPSSAS